ncbi:MAG: hypothetical protein RBU29_12640 [bacterium]|jgi:threonine dehydrogenase-like Zn-dependent dehydrogenase|nr:hypothetical protein [bacterium]
MPLELVFLERGKVDLLPYELAPVAADSVCVRTRMTGIRHGEDAHILRQGPVGCFPYCPLTWGCGEIVAVGEGVTAFQPGEWVHGPMGHRELQLVPASQLYMLGWMKPEFSVFIEPGIHGLSCVRRAGIRYGDTVAVVGLGTIGLMALQYILASGAREVWAVDPLPRRLEVARRLGSQHVWRCGMGCGQEEAPVEQCEVVIELSGLDAGLMTAMSLVKREGILCGGGERYSREAKVAVESSCRMKATQVRWIESQNRETGLEELVVYSIASKQILVWPILSDTVPFAEAPRFYQRLQEKPEQYVKSILIYPV